MTRTVRLREEADWDLVSAATWYERQRAGLGREFLSEALNSFDLPTERPLSYPIVLRDIRRALMGRFPFAIYFRVERSDVVVIAVLHGSRHPQRWRRRG
jgi:plasmid stabilization system protein ParE